MASPLRLGTRGSPLALAQARETMARLVAAHAELGATGAIEIVPIRTSGDRPSSRTLAEEGGKGLFTKEIEEALLAGTIDLAVHSLKDMPTELPPGLVLASCLPREDPRDALIAKGGANSLADLAPGAVVGTASLRRTAQLLHCRPDLAIVPMRGNVGTRLRKLADGEVAATVLAVAGLRRLGQAQCISCVLEPDQMLPSAGQGIIAVEIRAADMRTRALVEAIDDRDARTAAEAERALLAALDGSCRTPIGALATLALGRVALDAMVIRPDGKAIYRTRRDGTAAEARAMGHDAGAELRRRAGADLFA